jgi:hypothetical protein
VIFTFLIYMYNNISFSHRKYERKF